MRSLRPVIAADQRHFGRRAPKHGAVAIPIQHGDAMSDEVRLFATTFAAGFLFVAVLIA